MLVRRGVFGRQRVARHLWRMLFGVADLALVAIQVRLNPIEMSKHRSKQESTK